MSNNIFPKLHFYDQDLIALYDKTWNIIDSNWNKNSKAIKKNQADFSIFCLENQNTIHQLEIIFSTFFLVYSNKEYDPDILLDNFYITQKENGAIHSKFYIEDSTSYFKKKYKNEADQDYNAVSLPLFSLAEYNLYFKSGNKKRLIQVFEILKKYNDWINNTFYNKELGLYKTKKEATWSCDNIRINEGYFIDFNCAQALNLNKLSEIADILNDKDLSMKYQQDYFSLKMRISKLMWSETNNYYFDLTLEKTFSKVKTLAAFWTLYANIANRNKKEDLLKHLKDKKHFYTENPFPYVSLSENTEDYDNLVYSYMIFVIVKGLENFYEYEYAQAISLQHIYTMINVLYPNSNSAGNIFKAYDPNEDIPTSATKNYIYTAGLISITLAIENVIGFNINIPKKIVIWNMIEFDSIGIENLSLKRNLITAICYKSNDLWSIKLESEKLYYFTLKHIKENTIKQLPIPSGKCSLIVSKLNDIKLIN